MESLVISQEARLFYPAEAGATSFAMELEQPTSVVSEDVIQRGCLASITFPVMLRKITAFESTADVVGMFLLLSLVGLTAGGLWGLREGLARSRRMPAAPAASAGASTATVGNIFNQAAQAASASTSAALNTASTKTAAAAEAAAAGTSAGNAAEAATSSAKSAEARAQAAVRNSPAFRVRLNAVLNSVTRRGTFVGNNAGVLGRCLNHLCIQYSSDQLL